MAYFYTYVDPDQMDNLDIGKSEKLEGDASDTKKKSNDVALKETSASTKL